jgi:threonine-phosphate decarboxylase
MKDGGHHGGNVYAAARELRRPIETILDFSASINPLGPSPNVKRALADGAQLIRHYPDPDSVRLRRILASRFALSPEHFVIGNGSTELIDLIPRALGIRSALILGPTFSEYADALRRAGARSRTVSATGSDGYRIPVERAMEWLRSYNRKRRPPGLVFLCNPNSPTGQACDREELLSLIKLANRSGTWVILDETFGEYCLERSVLPELSKYPRLIVLKSLTKFYALPGLRVGYSVSSPQVAVALRSRQPPWSVNVMAQQAAEAAILDLRHARRSLRYLHRERKRLAGRLSRLPGLRLFPTCANFFLIELPRPHRARATAGMLRRKGLLIRDCSCVPGLNERTIRIAVRAKRENDRLVVALTEALR